MRWLNHRNKLRRDIHDSRYLQNVWNKHGEDEFRFEVLETTLDEPTILVAREQFWIDRHSKKLLNSRKIAEQFSQDWYRTPESLETRQKASKRMKEYRDNLERNLTCAFCGKEFTTNAPGSNVQFCSPSCRGQHGWTSGKYKEERVCKVCGKTFMAIAKKFQMSCSKPCAHVEKSGLTFVDVPVIIQRVLSGDRIDAVASDYKVTDKVIRRLANRETFTNCSIPEELETAISIRKAENQKNVKPMDESIVRDIKNRLASGEDQRSIADQHRVSQKTVSGILRGSIGRKVVMPDEIETALENRRQNKGLKLSNADVAEIKRDIRNGVRLADIAERFGVSHPTIVLIKNGRLKYADAIDPDAA